MEIALNLLIAFSSIDIITLLISLIYEYWSLFLLWYLVLFPVTLIFIVEKFITSVVLFPGHYFPVVNRTIFLISFSASLLLMHRKATHFMLTLYDLLNLVIDSRSLVVGLFSFLGGRSLQFPGHGQASSVNKDGLAPSFPILHLYHFSCLIALPKTSYVVLNMKYYSPLPELESHVLVFPH